jgi:hypothetical protein
VLDSHVESLRDKLQAVATKVGDDGNLPAGSLKDKVEVLGISKVRETGGPTTLTVGAVVDGEVLKRVGTAIVSVPAGGAPVIISPAQITSNQNNYAPTGWSTASHVRLNSDAARDITGVDAAATLVQKKLINVGAFNITLKHEDAGSSAANRFLSFTGLALVIQPNDSVDIFIDVTTGKVRAGV